MVFGWGGAGGKLAGTTRWPLAPMEPAELKALHAELDKLEIGI